MSKINRKDLIGLTKEYFLRVTTNLEEAVKHAYKRLSKDKRSISKRKLDALLSDPEIKKINNIYKK